MDPALPLLSIDDATLTEGNSGTRAATFTVALSAASSQPVSVARASGTAAVGSDYRATSGTLTTPNGTTGSFRSLGTLPPDRWETVLWQDSVATGVNEFGTVVGTSHTAYSYPNPEDGSFDIYRAFVWADGFRQELPLNGATAINNAGQIVGNRNGNRAFLLTPADPALPLGLAWIAQVSGGTIWRETHICFSATSSLLAAGCAYGVSA